MHETYNDLSFLSEKIKIGEVEKLLDNFFDKKEHVIYIRDIKQILHQGLILKKCIESLISIKKIS